MKSRWCLLRSSSLVWKIPLYRRLLNLFKCANIRKNAKITRNTQNNHKKIYQLYSSLLILILILKVSSWPGWPQWPPHFKDLHILACSVERGKLNLINYRPLQWQTSCEQITLSNWFNKIMTELVLKRLLELVSCWIVKTGYDRKNVILLELSIGWKSTIMQTFIDVNRQ